MNVRLLRCAAALALLAGLAALPERSAGGDKELVTGKVLDRQFEQGKVKFDYLLYLPPGVPHSFTNTGLSGLVFLVVTTPASDE